MRKKISFLVNMLWQFFITLSCGVVGLGVLFRLLHIYLKTGKRVIKVIDGKSFHGISGDRIFDVIHTEIYKDHCYFKYGVSLNGVENPFVIDAGANVGLFSRWIGENYPTAVVHAAEPVPQLCECATANCAAFKDRVHIHQVGLSDKAGEASFTYMPTTTGGSTMFEGDLLKPLKKHPARVVASAIVLDLTQSLGTFGRFTCKSFASVLKTPIVGDVALYTLFAPVFLLFQFYAACAVERKRNVHCTLVTLDEMLEKLGGVSLSQISKIDLLKIDVEAAEYAVVMGGSDALWNKVQQVVIEVTDVDNRVDKIKAFLTTKGFQNVQVDSEQWEVHKYLEIFTIFATR